MDSYEQKLDKYANLAVRIGVNVQPGQTLFVNAPLESVELVRIIAKKAYEAGAKNVHVDWRDDELSHIKFKMAPDEAFTDYPMWKAKGLEEMAEGGAAFLTITSPNPDLMTDIDSARIATANKTNQTALYKYRSYLMADKNCWSIIAVPTADWARKLFPDIDSTEEAIAQMWDVIFQAARVNVEDPIQEWNEHIARLTEATSYLNNKQYHHLVYEAPGTNLTVELTENHVWHGGTAVSAQGTQFSPNMPTEEVFSMPHKYGVNGVVHSTKPLNYGGTVIDDFSLTFEQGKIVDFTAGQGYDTLKHLLDTDDGARRLGEVALVPHQSPISQTHMIFYDTLFDENASSHLAIGQAYPFNIRNGTTMSEAELAERGVNNSLVHVDFMIGSGEMNIDGVTKGGVREPLIRNGNWAALMK
jgi:aminopeptidase